MPPAGRIVPPPLPSDLEWIRTPALSLDALRGRIVLIEVWEASCINCLRSLPSVSRLQAFYAQYPFIAIGIHSPEYAFTATRNAVERASRRFGLDFPVASDSRKSFWKSWAVGGWPTTFLLDAQGRLAHLHQGEFSPGLMERRVQRLLQEIDGSFRFPASYPVLRDRNSYAPECGFATPHIPTMPGLDFLLNPEGVRPGETILYADPGAIARTEGTFYLRGPWAWLRAGLQRGAAPFPAAIGITYKAKEVYAIISTTTEVPQEVEILQDGRPLTEANKGQDVVIRGDGRSFLKVSESRLHYLVVNSDLSRHDLELRPQAAAFHIHGFSFGNRCQTDFPHR